MSIRILDKSEHSHLPIKTDHDNSLVVVLEDDETHEVKGYWVAQTVVHVEPVWLSESVQDSGFSLLKMYAGLLAALSAHGVKDFYAFADKADIASYIERLGLQLKPYVIYQGQVPKFDMPVLNEEKEQECLQQ